MNKPAKLLVGTVFIACLITQLTFAQDGLPLHWQLAGSKPQDFEVIADEKIKHAGKASLRLDFTGELFAGFMTFHQTIKADAYRGKRVRLSAWVKTKSPDSHAQLWFRLDALKRMPGFDNMGQRPIKGITDWQKYDLVLDVPDDVVAMVFGIMSHNQGTIWADDFSLEIVGNDVAVTNSLSPEAMNQIRNNSGLANAKLPPQPLNLDFEAGTNPIRKPVAIDPAIYATLTGYYLSRGGALFVVAWEDSKFTLDAGFRKIVLQPLSETEFFAKGMTGSSVFIKDEKGNASELIVKTDAGETRCKKLNLEEAKARAAQILSAAYAAKGGLEKLKAVRDLQFDSTRTIGETVASNYFFLSSQLQNRHEARDKKTGEITLTVSDGKNVWLQRGGRTSTASPQQFLGFWQQAWFHYTLQLLPGKTMEALALGEQQLKGKAVNVVMALVDGQRYFLSFDPQTNLLLRNMRPGGDDFFYDDYREVAGIKLPFKVTVANYVILMHEYRVNAGINPAQLANPQ